MLEYYSIQEMKREFNVTTRTLRYYEDQGLLQPFRRGKTRLYMHADCNRLQHIAKSKAVKFFSK